jgi:uncharacterized YccA/Bax inhibitor family protein
MGLFKGGNPAMSEKTFEQVHHYEGEAMTIRGTMNKFGLMFIMLLGGASFTWSLFYKSGAEAVMPWMWGSLIGGMIIAFIIIFKKTWAPFLALGYGLLEGLFLGAISAFYDSAFSAMYPSIIMHAVLLTFGCAAAMYFFYKTGLIKATGTFKKVIMIATASIGIFYLVAMVMRLFGTGMPYLHDNGPIGIGISVFIVAIAALNLILDFDMMDQGAAQGAPKYFEWYCAFGLMVTLVWLYLEILRLLGKLSSKD